MKYGYIPNDELFSLQWRHNECNGVSNHQHHDCLLNRLFGCRLKKTSKLRFTGLCAGNSAGTGEFLAQMASKAEDVSIWWRHHVVTLIHDVNKSTHEMTINYWGMSVKEMSCHMWHVLCMRKNIVHMSKLIISNKLPYNFSFNSLNGIDQST